MKDSKTWIYDIETISNCFTYTARNIDTNEVVQFVIWKHINQLDALCQHLYGCKYMVGFNNLSFDYPVLHHILERYWGTKTGEEVATNIYDKAQEVITQEFSEVRRSEVRIPQIDLFKIWHFDNKARMTSLKKLQMAMRYKNVQDMPFKHTDTIDNYEQVKAILEYNLNDVDSTLDFFHRSIPKLKLRKGIQELYDLDCINFSDSKIGEELTLKLYCDATRLSIPSVRRMRTTRDLFKFKECLPKYTKFETPEFNGLLEYFKTIEVTELKDSFKYTFDYKGFEFDFGTGGVHGCIKSGVYKSDDKYIICDIDVSRFYPSLAVANNLYPEHLGKRFTKVYKEGIVEPSFKAKKEGNLVMSAAYKLAGNVVYGKSNSQFSFLFDSLYTLKTTLFGQVSLAMLSEQLMTHVDNLTMLQANTDGISVIIPIKEKRNLYNLCKKWESVTGLSLEYVTYKQMIIRDVNSYIAEKPDGKIKYKGAFKTYEQMVADNEYHKAMSQMIVPHALSEFYIKGVPVEETINKSTNIFDFFKTYNAIGEFTAQLEYEDGTIVPAQKSNRYFISKNGGKFTKVKGDKVVSIEADKLVTLVNSYPDDFDFATCGIDLNYYIDECYKIIHKIDGTEERLEKEKRDLAERAKKIRQEMLYRQYCVDKIPTERQYLTYKHDWLVEKYGEPKELRNLINT